jgi:hypothetical protein
VKPSTCYVNSVLPSSRLKAWRGRSPMGRRLPGVWRNPNADESDSWLKLTLMGLTLPCLGDSRSSRLAELERSGPMTEAAYQVSNPREKAHVANKRVVRSPRFAPVS